MMEMESFAAQLPKGIGFEWTGLSREEKLAGSQAIILYGFAILAVFLCLAALYESWSIPLTVVMVVVKDEMVQAHPSPKRHVDAREHQSGNVSEDVACVFHALRKSKVFKNGKAVETRTPLFFKINQQ